MKKLLLATFALASFSAGAQTKKVIIEDYTGIWCQYCSDGTVVLDGLETANPTNLIAVASHNDNGYGGTADLLMIAEGKAIASGVGLSGFPAGGIDRKKFSGETYIGVSRSKWGSYFSQRAALTPIASVGIANRVKNTDGSYEADITVKFTTAPAAGVPLKVQVYILEDSIQATGTLAQTNNSGGPNGGANPLTWAAHKWAHNNVLRAALGGTWGYSDGVPATPVVGTVYKKHVKFNIADASTVPATVPAGGWKADKVRVVAFVAYDGTAAADQKEIINAEEVALKSFYKTGVEQVNNVAILSAYPNPAKLNSVVKVAYDIKENEKVTMSVYNAVGQLVATPYVSEEVMGSHTIQWNPSNDNLVPGVYLIEVSTASGKQAQRITLQ